LRRRVVVRLRVVPDFAALDFRAVDFLALADFVEEDFAADRRVLLVADVDLRVEAAFVPDFRRVVFFAPDVFFDRVFAAAEDLRVADLRVDDFRFAPDARSVKRFVRPASTVVAFSSCATPFATSSCARATALSTGFRSLDRFARVFFRGAMVFSHQSISPPPAQYGPHGKRCE
jgi:hypothetical protein